MRILLHICCANCAIFPFLLMKNKGEEVVGYFFNPNIHPYLEYQKRLDALKFYSEKSELDVIYQDEYRLEEFLRKVAPCPENRCQYCYTVRLQATAREAQRNHFDGFSTTLLYSIYQKHDLIKEIGERVAREAGIPFLYEDYRRGWKKGVEVSKAMGLYRQQYCGCIYSEKERYLREEKVSRGKEKRGVI
ncbi:MAG TPA: epoxyqueuosine reductase QueH [Thermodesulfobacteriota bacterium]|nr:epoxyqueuosine reductase QueH [Thermodesulfobacteriota bacterium]